ncbi:hypothetical protein [Paraburkholderia lycopersici]|uniref:hypothetical protein n=1 Tax=Paraburkholderia lycopersici TaxID=416944 RepID=UPI001160EC05|nr:hypothetical protein [Paraburkholderia lycopersici]
MSKILTGQLTLRQHFAPCLSLVRSAGAGVLSHYDNGPLIERIADGVGHMPPGRVALHQDRQ